MSDAKIPTPIVDKNGKTTTVWRKADGVLGNGDRVSAAVKGFGTPKCQPELSAVEKSALFEQVFRLRPREDSMFQYEEGFSKEFNIELTESYGFDRPEDSIRRMQQDDIGLERLTAAFSFDGEERTIHFVGTNLENKVAEFQDWLDKGAQSFDYTNFMAAFTKKASAIEDKTKAWLSISGDIAWTFDEELADRLVDGIAPY